MTNENEYVRIEETEKIKTPKEFKKDKEKLFEIGKIFQETIKKIRGTPEERAKRREKLKEVMTKVLEGLKKMGEEVSEEARRKREEMLGTTGEFTLGPREIALASARGAVGKGDFEAYDIGDIEVIRFGNSLVVAAPTGKEIFYLVKAPLSGLEVKKLSEIS